LPYYEFTIRIPDAYKDALIKKLSELGTLGVIEQRTDMIAYFPHTADMDTITSELNVIQALFDSSGQEHISFKHVLVPDQDWNATWQKSFIAIDIGERFTVLPPWEQPKDNRINLIVDPAMAFGTATTDHAVMLLLMERFAPDKTGAVFGHRNGHGDTRHSSGKARIQRGPWRGHRSACRGRGDQELQGEQDGTGGDTGRQRG
jgi:hypothetical protein